MQHLGLARCTRPAAVGGACTAVAGEGGGYTREGEEGYIPRVVGYPIYTREGIYTSFTPFGKK